MCTNRLGGLDKRLEKACMQFRTMHTASERSVVALLPPELFRLDHEQLSASTQTPELHGVANGASVSGQTVILLSSRVRSMRQCSGPMKWKSVWKSPFVPRSLFPKKEKGLLAFFVQSQAFDVVVYRRVALARSE